MSSNVAPEGRLCLAVFMTVHAHIFRVPASGVHASNQLINNTPLVSCQVSCVRCLLMPNGVATDNISWSFRI